MPAISEQERTAMHFQRMWRMSLWCVVMCLAAHPAAAITIQLNYTYDTGNFFGNGNPSGATAGAQAKAALEAAASFYSTILTDSFSVIQTPPTFHSSQFDGQVTWQRTENFNNPTTALNSSNFGRILSAQDPRIMQFALKFDF